MSNTVADRMRRETEISEDGDWDFPSHTSTASIRLGQFLKRRHRQVLLFWGVIFVIGLFPAYLFMKSVVLKYEAPKGTEGFDAAKEFKELFPSGVHDQDTAILINTRDKSPLLTEKRIVELRNFLSALNTSVVERGLKFHKPETILLLTYFALNDAGAKAASYSLLDKSSDVAKATAMVCTLSFVNPKYKQGSNEVIEFADWLDKTMKKHEKEFFTESTTVAAAAPTTNLWARLTGKEPKPEDLKILRVRATGIVMLGRDLQEGTEHDMLSVDVFAFPFALAVLAWVLESVRYLIIPLMCIGTTILMSFMIMYPISLTMDVISTAPSVMMSCGLAFSIDYSLFILSRVNEEIAREKANFKLFRAMVFVIDSAGHTIFVSAATIVVCWFSLLFFPVSFLATCGLGAGVTVFNCFLVNITLPPSMILTFPDFFLPKPTDHAIVMLEEALIDEDGQTSLREQIRHLEGSKWYQFAKFAYGTKLRAWVTVVLITAFCLSFIGQAVSFHHSESFQAFTPKNKDASTAADDLNVLFGGGRLFSYSLLINGESRQGPRVPILSNEFYDQERDLIQNLVLKVPVDNGNVPVVLPEGIVGLSHMRGYPVVFESSGSSTQSEISFTGCVKQVAETFAMNCLRDHCPNEALRCLTDVTCDKNLLCIQRCGTNVHCLTDCVDKSRLDSATVALGKCAEDKCLPKTAKSPASPVVVVGSSKQVIVKPDCLSVLLLSLQQLAIRKSDGLPDDKPSIADYTFITLELNVDPFSIVGGSYLDSIRDLLEDRTKVDGYRYYLAGGNSAGHDMVLRIFKLLPLVCCGILSFVFVIIGYTFRSVFIPIRSIYSITMTLSVVYGLGVLVYEHDLLAWTGWGALKNPVDALSWLPPAMLFPVVVGLSLDYDIFLLTRVFECKRAGMNDIDAILVGVARSGKIITAAAMIMAIAFAGLLFSSSAALNQCAFFLVISVLVDSFLIRSCLVPALMIIAGVTFKDSLNWYPSKFPIADY